MPLDDAMKFVSQNFDSYLQTLREKKRLEAPPDYSRMPEGFVPPTDHVSYLMNLLADGRMLTSLELKEILDFVVVRRDKLLAAEGLPLTTVGPPRPSEWHSLSGARFHWMLHTNSTYNEVHWSISFIQTEIAKQTTQFLI